MTIDHLFLIVVGICIFFAILMALHESIEKKRFGAKAKTIPWQSELKDHWGKTRELKTRFEEFKTQDAFNDQRFKDVSQKFDRIVGSIKKKAGAEGPEAEKEAIEEESEELVHLMNELLDMQKVQIEQSRETINMTLAASSLSEEPEFLKDGISKANDIFNERTDRIFYMLEETIGLIKKIGDIDMPEAGKEEVFPETFAEEPDLHMTEPLRDRDDEQREILPRARLHLLFAIISMIAGLACVIGGVYILAAAKQTMVLIAGGILIVIGGTMAAIFSVLFLSHRKSVLNIFI